MPVLSSNQSATTYTVQRAVNYARSYPELSPIFPTSGWSQEPALTLSNDTLQRILAEPLNWKWNRGYIPPFLTVSLQQDYVTQVTNLSWLENATIYDINNGTNNITTSGGPRAPKPNFTLEAVREILPNWRQGTATQISFIPNSLATMGTWQANTAYKCGYGQNMTPTSPIQQFVDANGNILFIDSTVLGLGLNSPGFTGAPITPPSNSPYGTTGSTQPSAPVSASPGTLVQDGTVIWTVADPNGFAIRLDPLPSVNGLCWLVAPQYQKLPPQITSTQQTIAPIPDAMGWMFRDMFVALLHIHVGSKTAQMRYQMAEEAIIKTRLANDRENESFGLIPSSGLIDRPRAVGGLPIGPAYPFLVEY